MFKSGEFDNLVWQKDCKNIPNNIQNWLFDDDSLTRKLKQKYSGFQVKVLAENTINNTLQREVYLCNDTTPLVYAISFIPIDCTQLQNLSNTPLGEILFQNGKRKEIFITEFKDIWGRKSLFNFENFEIIVCEFFLETLYA